MIKQLKEKLGDAKYFQKARSWTDDVYTHTLVSRNRYQLAFLVAMGFASLLLIMLALVVLNQHVSMVVVHRNESGFTYITLEDQKHVPEITRKEIEADIVRYVVARESYHPATYQEQSSLVSLLGDASVNSGYELNQGKSNLNAPVHLLKNTGYREVRVKSILFLDNINETNPETHERHKNLAQVNFVMSDHLFSTSNHIDTPYTALISWDYRGAPSNPEKMWKNWSGFTVTAYQLSQVSVNKG